MSGRELKFPEQFLVNATYADRPLRSIELFLMPRQLRLPNDKRWKNMLGLQRRSFVGPWRCNVLISGFLLFLDRKM